MELLCEELGRPQDRYETLHVVGTNGKSSVTAMTEVLLLAAGRHTGSCLSPHLLRWSERTRIDGEEISPEAFASAVEQVAGGVSAVEGRLEKGERITQFEAAIAASLVAFADAGVDVAVIEAGLGGRLDATNVIHSRATALTSIGLDHTAWLGETKAEIAAEKLAVLEPATTLLIGRLDREIGDLAAATADDRRARLIVPGPLEPPERPAGWPPFQVRNGGIARALAATVAELPGPDALGDALGAVPLQGRAEELAGDPPLIVDAAHNGEGAEALAEALPGLAEGRPAIGCISILADKDVDGIAAALGPVLDLAVCTEAAPGPAMGRPGTKPIEAAKLAAAMSFHGCATEVEPEPERALARTLALARERHGVAICAGSHYLLRYAWTARRAQNSSQ